MEMKMHLPLNRVAIILNEHGEFDGVVADSEIEFYTVQPSSKHDRVYRYGSGQFGPQYVQMAFNGNPVGHRGDGTLDPEGGVGKYAPSRPALAVVSDETVWAERSRANAAEYAAGEAVFLDRIAMMEKLEASIQQTKAMTPEQLRDRLSRDGYLTDAGALKPEFGGPLEEE